MSYESDDDDHVMVGPWGGLTAARWDDGVFSSVRQVVISYGAAIDSILTEYDKKGCSVWSDKHGGGSSFKTNKLKFNYPEEFLVSISGYYGSVTDYGPVLVRSLLFESNKKKYGPFGLQQGTHFSFPMSGGMVVGFHGRSSWSLESIGVHLKPLLIQNPPANFNYTASQNYASNEIPEIPKGYELATVREKQDNKFGIIDNVGDDSKNYPSEILTHKNGYSASSIHRRTTIVKSVSVHPNRRVEGPFGAPDEQGIFFSSGSNYGILAGFPARKALFPDGFVANVIEKKPPVPRPFNDSLNRRVDGTFGAPDEQGIFFSSGSNYGILAGFPTRKGLFPDGVVANVIEKNPPVPRPSNDSLNMNDRKISRPLIDSFNMNDRKTTQLFPDDRKTSQVFPGIVKEPAWFSSGPWGGNGGKLWDDGMFSGVKKIFLFKGDAIYSIQFEYDINGQSVESARHGSGIEGSFHMITFQYPLEVLKSFCGYYELLTGDRDAIVIKSLTFFTNKGRYGPIGEESGTFFTSTKIEGKIVGFHGKSGCYLNAIGVHMQVQR